MIKNLGVGWERGCGALDHFLCVIHSSGSGALLAKDESGGRQNVLVMRKQ